MRRAPWRARSCRRLRGPRRARACRAWSPGRRRARSTRRGDSRRPSGRRRDLATEAGAEDSWAVILRAIIGARAQRPCAPAGAQPPAGGPGGSSGRVGASSKESCSTCPSANGRRSRAGTGAARRRRCASGRRGGGRLGGRAAPRGARSAPAEAGAAPAGGSRALRAGPRPHPPARVGEHPGGDEGEEEAPLDADRVAVARRAGRRRGRRSAGRPSRRRASRPSRRRRACGSSRPSARAMSSTITPTATRKIAASTKETSPKALIVLDSITPLLRSTLCSPYHGRNIVSSRHAAAITRRAAGASPSRSRRS